MKNEIRPIDDNALSRMIREYMGDYQNATAGLDAACRAVLSMLGDEGQTPTLDHFPDTKKMTPLTLEQLREMDGWPVLYDGMCFIVRLNYQIYGDAIVYCDDLLVLLEEAVKSGVYAYCPPTHIDREAWEPCEYCNDQEDPCLKDGCFRKNRWKCGFTCDKYQDFQERKRILEKSKFCPRCGRPMTEEAWAQLEKRLRG